MRKTGRRTTRKSTGNQGQLTNRENSNSVVLSAELPNFGANIGPNSINSGNISNLGHGGVPRNEENRNLISSNEVSTNMLPSQTSNSVSIISSLGSAAQAPILQQGQGTQDTASQHHSGLTQITVWPNSDTNINQPRNILPLPMGSMPLLTNIGTIVPFKEMPTEDIQE